MDLPVPARFVQVQVDAAVLAVVQDEALPGRALSQPSATGMRRSVVSSTYCADGTAWNSR